MDGGAQIYFIFKSCVMPSRICRTSQVRLLCLLNEWQVSFYFIGHDKFVPGSDSLSPPGFPLVSACVFALSQVGPGRDL